MRERPGTDGGGGLAGSERPEQSPAGPRRRANVQDIPNAPAVQRGADTIDALFAPIEWEEATGRVWFMDGARLAGLNVRLGITDGSASELLGVVGRPASQRVLLRRRRLFRTDRSLSPTSPQRAPTPVRRLATAGRR